MVRGSTPDTAIGWSLTMKRAAARCCRSPARADVAAGVAQFGLGDKGDPGLGLGVDQRAGLALAAVRHCMVAFHDALTVGFDSGWSKNLPPILYRHAVVISFHA